MPKPASLKWAKGLSIVQLTLGVFACAFFIWLFQSSSNSEVLMGMQEGVAEGLGKDTYYLSTAEGIGYLCGIFIFALLSPVFTLLAIAKRSKGFAITSLVFNGVNLVTSFSPVTLAILILMSVKPSRDYLHLTK